MFSLLTYSAKETQVLANLLAQEVLRKKISHSNALVFGLSGQLGSGKTTFIQGFMAEMGIKKKITSPTFVLIKKFQIPKSKSQINSKIQIPKYIFHVDCYRVKNSKELLDLGLKEILADPQNLVLIEWPELVRKHLPKKTIGIKFKHGEKVNERLILFS